ncbi:MAG TPA: nucleotide sugar dehydrogenase [Kofleriaceae bacterium]|nr:nucleotide sugar dehydrogenase [Kofleriaceae bacterium]
MRIVVIGSGFVGLTHAAVLAETGHHVVACDVDEERLAAFRSGRAAAIERYVSEPGLSAVVRDNLGRRLLFDCDVAAHLGGAEAVFLCLPTPPQPSGATDLTCYLRAASDLARALARAPGRRRLVLVNKSTVPIGTARQLRRILDEHGLAHVGVASNPEFLPQGGALEASRRPDRIVIGADQPEDFALLRRVYAPYVNHVRIRYIETTPETAEAIKYVSNALLLTYISFWNGVGARLAETLEGVRMGDLRVGVTADARISTWGSYVGNGAGGSCFGKDIRSLMDQLGRRGQPIDLLRAVYDINQYQRAYLLDRAALEAGFNFNNKVVALLGLAFKKNTNDMRDSSALEVIRALLARGVAGVRAYDPLVDEAAARRWLDPRQNHLYERIGLHGSAAEAVRGSDALFISSDAEEFRSLADTIAGAVAPPYLILDGRRMIADHGKLVERGFDYLAVGGTLEGPAAAAARQRSVGIIAA